MKGAGRIARRRSDRLLRRAHAPLARIVDEEAHKMSAYSEDKKTLAFQVGEAGVMPGPAAVER